MVEETAVSFAASNRKMNPLTAVSSVSHRWRSPFTNYRTQVRRKLSVDHWANWSSSSQILNLSRLERPPGMLRHGRTPLSKGNRRWWWRTSSN
jgi:hypothetical protein